MCDATNKWWQIEAVDSFAAGCLFIIMPVRVIKGHQQSSAPASSCVRVLCIVFI